MDRLLLTGASGFVGRRVLAEAARRGVPVTALCRRPPSGGRPVGDVRWLAFDVAGDVSGEAPLGGLLEAPPEDPWVGAFDGVGAVLHLAAATGAAPASEHRRVNEEGTRRLLRAAARAGVERFVFVSTIGVRFPDLRGYPYGRSKAAAEGAVRESGLRWTVVRPTAVFGDGSPIVASLSRLAGLPVLPLLGGAPARLQPVAVDALAATLLDVVGQPETVGGTIEVGGPEIATMEELLRRLRQRLRGRRGPALRLPLGPLTLALGVLERVGVRPPVTAGQLVSFVEDGVLDPEIGRVVGETPLPPADGSADVPAGRARGGDRSRRLRREAGSLSRVLVGSPPGEPVVARYLAAHERLPGLMPSSLFERAQVGAARLHPWPARMADAYAALLARESVLRRKTVLLLAILESSAGHHRSIDRPDARGRLGTVAALGLRGLSALPLLAVGFAIFVPVHLLSTLLSVSGPRRGVDP